VIKSSEAVWAATDRHKHANTNAAVTTAMEEFLIFKTSATYVGEIAVKSEKSYLRRNGKTKTRQRTPPSANSCGKFPIMQCRISQFKLTFVDVAFWNTVCKRASAALLLGEIGAHD
jgi:hypothetical protein